MKKIILIWDFDGAIGQINSTFPYNFNFENFQLEIDNVIQILDILNQYKIKTCFAITGFSAENGIFPYVFPNLIKQIYENGHEIASHSWKHEWTSIFMKSQIDKSLKRSKLALEKVINNPVVGFVPPHNRPMSWKKRFALSIGDRGFYPFFNLADNENLIQLLKLNNYKWIRVSYKNIFQKLKLTKFIPSGKVINYNNFVVFENHYNGFDSKIIDYIKNSNHQTYTISAHPLMLSFENKKESLQNFKIFLSNFAENPEYDFVLPSSFLN
jgi:peptidoglycan/xylan/chitin deacetylase (PgdA/CDA1 family)